ncbi:MAG TPA: LamB/YcsF family protein, partial [Paenibacillaceae bacterium]|nr:LamB/YcsF family protein [Paenibacillaceae bacterium]
TPRSHPQALIHDANQAIAQVVSMIKEGKVIALTGEEVSMQADTLCIHGDGAHALVFAELIRRKLAEEEIQVR